MFPRHTVPGCYGHLFDSDAVQCGQCLLNLGCQNIVENGLRPLVTSSNEDVPKDRRLLVLHICRKFGISTTYYSKKLGELYEVTEENYEEYSNLSFLLTSRHALEKLFLAGSS